MVTPDKDFAQLVSENIFMYNLLVWVMVSKFGCPEVWRISNRKTWTSHRFLGNDGDAADNIQDYQA
jgi:hypothetical protein